MRINPYEQMGIWFEDVLDYIINQNKNPTIDEALNFIMNFLSQYLGTTQNPAPDSLKYLLKETSAWGINNYFDDIEVRRNRLNITSEQLNYVDQIYANTGLNVEQLNQYYIDIENSVLNSDLENFEKKSLIIATCIGKKSALYWSNVKANPSNLWHSYKVLNNYPEYVYSGVTSALDGALLISGGRIDRQIFITAYSAAATFVSI